MESSEPGTAGPGATRGNRREAKGNARPVGLVGRKARTPRRAFFHSGSRPHFGPGEHIERRLYDLLETLIETRSTRERQAFLQHVNLSLEVLRFQMRLAHELRFSRTNSYGFATPSLDEIGHMVGGWVRAEPA